MHKYFTDDCFDLGFIFNKSMKQNQNIIIPSRLF